MDRSGRRENHIAGAYLAPIEQTFYFTVQSTCPQLAGRERLAKSYGNLAIGFGIDHVPGFGFSQAIVVMPRVLVARMHLNGKTLGREEQLY